MVVSESGKWVIRRQGKISPIWHFLERIDDFHLVEGRSCFLVDAEVEPAFEAFNATNGVSNQEENEGHNDAQNHCKRDFLNGHSVVNVDFFG